MVFMCVRRASTRFSPVRASMNTTLNGRRSINQSLPIPSPKLLKQILNFLILWKCPAGNVASALVMSSSTKAPRRRPRGSEYSQAPSSLSNTSRVDFGAAKSWDGVPEVPWRCIPITSESLFNFFIILIIVPMQVGFIHADEKEYSSVDYFLSWLSLTIEAKRNFTHNQ